jgi:hypothetical protein
MTLDEPFAPAERLAARLAVWRGRLRATPLADLLTLLLDVSEPLGPLGAQVLWVAQPALSLMVSREAVADLAQVLERPGGVAWLRAQLAAESEEER